MKKKSAHDIEQEIVEKTSAYQKTLNYIESLINDEGFRKDIELFRKKYEIPKNGLRENFYYKNGERYVDTPKEMRETAAYEDLEKIAEKYGLDFMWSGVIEHYAIHNNFSIKPMGFGFEILDLKDFLSGPEEMEFEGEKWMDNSKMEYLETRMKTHPVAILLTPYATQRDVVDYVKKLYKTAIEPLLNNYRNNKIKLGKIRKKSYKVQVRNQFIYKNRLLPSKELLSLVAKNFGDILDYTYLNKIIASEGKKNK